MSGERRVTIRKLTPKAVKVEVYGLPGDLWLPRSAVSVPASARRGDRLFLSIPGWILDRHYGWVGDPDM